MELNTIYSRAIRELPLILKATFSTYSFKGSDSHDEVIHEFIGDFFVASIQVIIPLLKDHLVLFGADNVVLVEDDHTEVHIGYFNIDLKGGIQLIDL